MRRVSTICAVMILLAACGGGGGGGGSTTARSPAAPSSAATAEPMASCISPEQQAAGGAAVRGAAGDQVDAVVLGSGTTGVVLANMSDNDVCAWFASAALLASKGYRAAVFAYSGRQGADADLLDVASELRRRGSTRIVLMGASKGGTAALTAAKRAGAVAVVELSAPSSYESMDAVAAVKGLTVPTWFAVGEQDEDFVESAKELYAASPAATKHLELVASASHGTALLPDGGVQGMIDDFLAKNAPAGT